MSDPLTQAELDKLRGELATVVQPERILLRLVATIDTLQAENARLRGDLDTALGLRRMESRRVDTLRAQAEALATALEHACSGQLSKVEWARVVDEADAALRAFREATP